LGCLFQIWYLLSFSYLAVTKNYTNASDAETGGTGGAKQRLLPHATAKRSDYAAEELTEEF
jgi:hypothetical protein